MCLIVKSHSAWFCGLNKVIVDACNDIQALNSFQRIGKDSLALPLHSITKSLPTKSGLYLIGNIFLQPLFFFCHL